jgi:hypothetical protein
LLKGVYPGDDFAKIGRWSMLEGVYSSIDAAKIRRRSLLEVIKPGADVNKTLVKLMQGGCLAGNVT